MIGEIHASWNNAGDVYIISAEDSNPLPGQAQVIMQPKEARDLISQIQTAIMKAESKGETQ